jgi:hypothetical protein
VKDYFWDDATIASTGDRKPLSTEGAKRLTTRIKQSLEHAYLLLYEAHLRRAWTALGYPTFEAYVQAEFSMSRSRAYQLLDQARVVQQISEAASTDVDIPEAVARDLKPVLPKVVERVRAQVAAAAPEEAPTITAGVIREARLQQQWDKQHAESARTRSQPLAPAPVPEEPTPPPPPNIEELERAVFTLARWMTDQPLSERPHEHLMMLADRLGPVREALTEVEADVRLALAAEELKAL